MRLHNLKAIAAEAAIERRRARRRRLRAENVARMKRELWAALGDHCVLCGCLDDGEVDHPKGRTWEPRNLNQHDRLKRYLVELKSGVPLRRLCRSCNGTDGAVLRWQLAEIQRRTLNGRRVPTTRDSRRYRQPEAA